MTLGHRFMFALRRDGQWVGRGFYGRDGDDPIPPASVFVRLAATTRDAFDRRFIFELAAEQPDSGDWAYDEVHRPHRPDDVEVQLLAGSKL